MNKKIWTLIIGSGLLVGASAGVAINKLGDKKDILGQKIAIVKQSQQEENKQKQIARNYSDLYDPYASTYNTMQPDSDFEPTGFAGSFLASHFAQNNYDWKTANKFLDHVIKDDPQNAELVKRSMILAIGSGDINTAAKRAKDLLDFEPDNSFALLILVVKSMSDNDLKQASDYITEMPSGDMTAFITPILNGWAQAGLGNFDVENFNETPFHLFHKAMIAAYLGKDAEVRNVLNQIMSVVNLNEVDAEHAADLYVYLGEEDKALPIYKGVYIKNSNNPRLEEKMKAIEDGDTEKLNSLIDSVKMPSIQEGAARALYDMSYLLYRELSDSSAKIFANMALVLDPNMPQAYLLLADSAARNEQYEEAIKFLEHIPKDNDRYMASQRRIAELWSDAGDMDKAVALLEDLFTKYDDVESLIRIGDMYREEEEYAAALKIYNKAAGEIGKDIPEEYWYLLYARGMAYEREGDWDAAEKDLKAALVYRPNHPYLLNYLGYSWADQGKKLDEAKALISKAVQLRPTDGYIVDSLGWVTYMMGDYKEATKYLERAVQLLPYDSTINDHLGDALWKVGRRTEAHFQWERALNASDDETLSEKIRGKMRFGLDAETEHAKNDVKTEEERSQER